MDMTLDTCELALVKYSVTCFSSDEGDCSLLSRRRHGHQASSVDPSDGLGNGREGRLSQQRFASNELPVSEAAQAQDHSEVCRRFAHFFEFVQEEWP
jgi:hypothetical protein